MQLWLSRENGRTSYWCAGEKNWTAEVTKEGVELVKFRNKDGHAVCQAMRLISKGEELPEGTNLLSARVCSCRCHRWKRS